MFRRALGAPLRQAMAASSATASRPCAAKGSAASSSALSLLSLAATTTTTATIGAHYYFSTLSPLRADEGKVKSASSSLLREASPAAPRSPGYDIVFLSTDATKRKEWHAWIGYFRELGYNCIDLNLALEAEGGGLPKGDELVSRLTEELTSQIRMASLQRLPILFVRARDAAVPVQQVSGKDPRMSALIILAQKGDEAPKTDGVPRKLRTLVVEDVEGDEAVRKVESWLMSEGFQ